MKSVRAEVEFVHEPWTEVTLANQDVIRTKIVVTGVRQKLNDDGSAMIDNQGRRMYEMDLQQVTTVESALTVETATEGPVGVMQ